MVGARVSRVGSNGDAEGPERAPHAPDALVSIPVVTVGRWTSRSYPLCGWDDCGEDPAHEAGDLYQLVKWVVDGWFREGLTAGAVK